MARLPRRLHVLVGTGLLGASLTLGCTAKPEAAADKKEEKKPEPKVEPPPEPIKTNMDPVEDKPVENKPTRTMNNGPMEPADPALGADPSKDAPAL